MLGIASETTSLLNINRQRKHNRYRPWNDNWNLSDSSRVELTARPSQQIDSKNRFMANTWKCETHCANADPEIVTENWVTVERDIIFENWVATEWWNRQRTLIHDWRMKSIEKRESSLTLGIASETTSLLNRNRQRKHNRCRPWYHNWNLSDSWRVESTAWPRHQIDRKNRSMANTWNCETQSPNAHQEIVTENWVTVEREIIFENWVAADWWNRHRTLIHDWRMKSIQKTESSLTHGIASETASLVTRNRQRKHSRSRPWNDNWNLSDSWRVELTARPRHQIDSKNRLMATTWNCHTHSTNADPEIVTENSVTVEREIIFENWVAAD